MSKEEPPKHYIVESSDELTCHSVAFKVRERATAYVGLLPNSPLFNHLENVRDDGEFVPDPDKSQTTFSSSKNLEKDKLTIGAQYCLVASVFGTGDSPISEMLHLQPVFLGSNNKRPMGEREEVKKRLLTFKKCLTLDLFNL